MNVHVLPAGPIQTNAYLLTSPETGEAVLIDAPEGIWAEVEPILREEGCRLSALWLTHGHWDHTQGAAEVVRKSGAPVLAHRADRPMIETPEVMQPLLLSRASWSSRCKVDRWLDDGEALEALGADGPGPPCARPRPGASCSISRGAGAAFVGRRPLPGERRAHRPPRGRLRPAGGLDPHAHLHAPGRDDGFPGTRRADDGRRGEGQQSPCQRLTTRGFMRRAIELALRGWGATHPNPMVGCVLVEDGAVTSEGFHAADGGPHAERVALASRMRNPGAGATLYVTHGALLDARPHGRLHGRDHRGRHPPRGRRRDRPQSRPCRARVRASCARPGSRS